ncbi:MAG: DNA mismatch repair ATPase, partial [Harvfovirus sp.]
AATTIIKDYLSFHDQYAKKYGEARTLVLMQVGSFYESYATNERGPKLHEISNTINIICTRKDKSISEINEKNPYMMGFPMISSQKYIGILINNGYTLVVVDQVTPPPNPERKVTGVYSPSTYIENMNTHDTNYSLCIYFEEEHQKNGGNLLCAGMAAIELSTGKCYIHEAHSNSSDTKYALDETVRFITALNPSETLIYHSEKKNSLPAQQNSNDKIENIVSYLELGNKYVLVKNTYDKKYSKPAYQNEFLSKIYKDTGILSPIEYLGLDRLDYARLAFLLLLEFAYEHNESIINDIAKPENYMDNNHMLLGNNAIYQLNIVESDIYKENVNTKYKCLFDVESLQFLDVMMHATNRFFNQGHSDVTTDTISTDVRVSINRASRVDGEILYDSVKVSSGALAGAAAPAPAPPKPSIFALKTETPSPFKQITLRTDQNIDDTDLKRLEKMLPQILDQLSSKNEIHLEKIDQHIKNELFFLSQEELDSEQARAPSSRSGHNNENIALHTDDSKLFDSLNSLT